MPTTYSLPTLDSSHPFSRLPQHQQGCWNCQVRSFRAGALLFCTWRREFEVRCPRGVGNAYFSLKQEVGKRAGQLKSPRSMNVSKIFRKWTAWKRFLKVLKRTVILDIFLEWHSIKNLKICQSLTKVLWHRKQKLHQTNRREATELGTEPRGLISGGTLKD